jgi:NAD kinase
MALAALAEFAVAGAAGLEEVAAAIAAGIVLVGVDGAVLRSSGAETAATIVPVRFHLGHVGAPCCA